MSDKKIGESLNQIQTFLMLKKPFLTVEESSELTGFDTRYFYDLIRNKKIEPYKPLGKVLFFKTQDILNLGVKNKDAQFYKAFYENSLIDKEFDYLDSETQERVTNFISQFSKKYKL